jgi:pyruvate/2-oxoglutarate dehydrogenase complex dihydrolipoamide dehydrogenase (E3) component
MTPAVHPILPLDAYNERLSENVRPPAWKNPAPAPIYNLVVIGAGTAGLVMAAGAAGLGARVALIERHLMGGDCLNYGCVPSKALLRVARGVGEIVRARSMGIAATLEEIDFAAVMERMRRIRAELSSNDSAARFKQLGVDIFFGEARFLDANQIRVGDSATLRFRRAAVASGGRPAPLPIAGLEEAGYLTNQSIFSLTELPRHLAIIGGGAIGCELAQAFTRFGVEVTIVEATAQILGREDRDAARAVAGALLREGVKIITGATVTWVHRRDSQRLLQYESDGIRQEITADHILVGVGRLPELDSLDLAAANIEYGPEGIKVDDHLRTTNRRVYAAGDVCTGLKFTHMADAMARIVIRNALFYGRARTSSLLVPSCIYTDPEIAQVGLTEQEARVRGIPVRSFAQSFEGVDRAVIDSETEGFVKLQVAGNSGRIIGATVVGSHASELISAISMAMHSGIRIGHLTNVIHPYPTRAEVLRKLADAFNRSRLTPRAGRVLAKWFALTR